MMTQATSLCGQEEEVEDQPGSPDAFDYTSPGRLASTNETGDLSVLSNVTGMSRKYWKSASAWLVAAEKEGTGEFK